MSLEARPFAHVVSKHIYPVKGMQGVEMDSLSLRSVSVAGDRTRAFLLADSTKTPNFLDTIRFPGLLQYAPNLVTPQDPSKSNVEVLGPDKTLFLADESELLEEISRACGQRLALMHIGRAAYHSMPVSLLSLDSVRDIERQVGFAVDPRRFRENLIIQTDSDEPYQEDSLIGKVVRFGDRPDSAEIAVLKSDGRCATVDLDPTTGERSRGIFETIKRTRENKLGVYASVFKEGTIMNSDTIYVLN